MITSPLRCCALLLIVASAAGVGAPRRYLTLLSRGNLQYVPGDKIDKVLKWNQESCHAFSLILARKVRREKRRGLNKSGSKVFVAVVSYRLAVSERTLPVEIPLNPCSAAADCAVPPGETLPGGLITGHPVCAEPRCLPTCLLHNGRVVRARSRLLSTLMWWRTQARDT